MVEYLKHTRIDKRRWDDCIARSLNRRIYAFSWYLDLVCPGWEALVEGDYHCVFPMTCKTKWPVHYLYQPFFAQQLGVFSPDPITKGQFDDFFSAIPSRFRFVEIHLNPMNHFPVADGEITQRLNHEMDLRRSYEEVVAGYAQNTKRNLRKAAEMRLVMNREVSPHELISLFRENFGQKEGKLTGEHYEIIGRIIRRCVENGTGHIIGVCSETGLLSAAAFFLFDLQRVYFLFAASAPAARENGAMFQLIDRFINLNTNKTLILDFEGGNDPNLGRFYKSFGAAEVSYPALRINRLPGIVVNLLYFARKLRQ